MKQNEIPQEVVEYAQSFMEDFEYSDRLRFACSGDAESEQEYIDIKERGCCGNMDFVKFPHLVGGKEYYFGFNYGH